MLSRSAWLVFGLIGAPLLAQGDRPLPRVENSAARPPGPPNPAFDALAVDALAKGASISRDAAAEQISLEDDILTLVNGIEASNSPQFAGIYMDRRPEFAITIRHTGPRNQFESGLNIPPRLKRFVRFEAAERNLAAMKGQQQRLLRSPAFADGELLTYLDVRSGSVVVRGPNANSMKQKAQNNPDF